MKLYLSSNQVPDPKAFAKFIGKELSNIKLGLVFNAKDYKPKEEYDRKLSETTSYFSQFGIKVEKIDLLDYVSKSEALLNKFKEFDVLWFNGGNTYCLRYALAKSKAEEVLIKALEAGVVYGGDSAGAILVGPTLKYYDAADDPNLAQETIYDGLGLTNIAILPHWGSGEYDHVLGGIEEKLKSDGYSTTRLTDNEYLLIENGEIISV